MSPASSTKQRILGIARELFARQGYTGTSIADIARELGTSTAALYYHFPSKAGILRGLVAEPLAAYTRLVGSLREQRQSPAGELLGAFIDLAADSRELAVIIDRDPAVLEMITEQLPESSQMNERVIEALTGRGADRAAVIRAHAALGVVKNATMAAMSIDPAPEGDAKLTPADRAEILDAALRALNA